MAISAVNAAATLQLERQYLHLRRRVTQEFNFNRQSIKVS